MIKSSSNTNLSQIFVDGKKQLQLPCEIADGFNKYFVNIGPDLAKNIPSSTTDVGDFLPPSTLSSMSLDSVTVDEVSSIIRSLKLNASPGLDEIPATVIKFACTYISKPITCLINSSFRHGVFPDVLKMAKVIPVFKTGDRSLLSNYRPISILTTFSKIFEKAIVTRLNSFLFKFNILYENQYGFRKNHSTVMALLSLVDKVADAMDKKKASAAVFLDLSKAFDTIDHDILLKKLSHYGIRGIALDLLQSYLNNRSQSVVYQNVASSYSKITCGVPQGSILGPVLFLIYINDIYLCSKLLHFILFADDTTIFLAGDSWQYVSTTMENELLIISDWFKANKLSLNIKKTNLISFLRSKQSPIDLNIKIDGSRIAQVTSTKFLGVEIDQHLSWKGHIKKICSKICSVIGILSKIRFKISQQTALLLYNSLILHHLNYCNLIWASNYKAELVKIQVLQRRALRICTYSPRLIRSNILYRSSRSLDVVDLNKLQIVKFMYSVYHSLMPVGIMSLFQRTCTMHHHTTRGKENFYHQNFTSNVRKFSIAINGPNVWNSVPSHIKLASSVNSCKCLFKKFLFDGYFD
jgi:hypothetical protein